MRTLHARVRLDLTRIKLEINWRRVQQHKQGPLAAFNVVDA
jgi:hypothetical protein